MKKTLLLTLALWITLSIIIRVNADGACEHSFLPDDSNNYQIENVVTSQKHGYRIYCSEACSKCGQKRTVIYEEQLSDHCFVKEKDMGHQYPQNLHNYRSMY